MKDDCVANLVDPTNLNLALGNISGKSQFVTRKIKGRAVTLPVWVSVPVFRVALCRYDLFFLEPGDLRQGPATDLDLGNKPRAGSGLVAVETLEKTEEIERDQICQKTPRRISFKARFFMSLPARKPAGTVSS